MKHYLWIIDAALLPYATGTGGASPSYVLAGSSQPADVVGLAGATVLLIIRRPVKDVLFARLFVTRVEQFEDGYNRGDFLLTTDLLRSVRVLAGGGGDESRSVSESAELALGLHDVSATTARAIEGALAGYVGISLNRPSVALLRRIGRPAPAQSIGTRAQRYLRSVASSLSLEEMWAVRGPVPMPPLAHFAYQKAKEDLGVAAADAMIPELCRLDVTAALKSLVADSDLNDGGSPASSVGRGPSVDTELTSIDADMVYARRFIAGVSQGLDLGMNMGKVEHAERTHQDMLRDVVRTLGAHGVPTLQSSSIDLLVAGAGGDILFELKSANRANALGQAAGGAFQLACYQAALVDDGRKTWVRAIIMSTTRSPDLDLYLRKALREIDIEILFYDEFLEWPHKVEGLFELIGRMPGTSAPG